MDVDFEALLEEAAFLWFQRNHAVNSPGYTLHTLTQIDMRLTGLFRLLGSCDEFIPRVNQGFDPEFPDESLCLALAAVPWLEAEMANWMIEALEKEADLEALIDVLAWAEFDEVEEVVNALWASNNPDHKFIAMAAWRVHRQQPQINFLQAAQYGERVISELLRLIGEMGLVVHQNMAARYLKSESAEIRYWAAYACLLLGEPEESSDVIRDCIDQKPSCSYQPLQVCVPYLDSETVTPWVNTFSRDDKKLNVVLKTFEVLGVKRFIPWLVGSVKTPDLAADAALAFCTMTGMDLDHEEFGDLTVLFSDPSMVGSDEVKQAVSDLVPDWFESWWMENEDFYVDNVRYFLGRPTHNIEHLEDIVEDGNQVQRQRAAYEIALTDPRKALFDHQAPGFRQCL